MYFADDRPFTDAARFRAVVWSYRPKAVLSGLAAAWWHHLVATAPEIVDVTVGWQVLRFTRLDLVERPQRVLTQIRRAISAR